MSGQEVRALILGSGLRLWQVAYEMGYDDNRFSRRLRKPFSEKEVAAVKATIEKLLKEKEQEEK